VFRHGFGEGTMNKVEAIIFDFDGVLVESVDVKTQAFAEMYKQYGPKIVEQVVAYHLEHGGVSRYEKFRYYQETFLGQSLSSSEEKILGDIFSKMVKDAVVNAPWVPGAYEFISEYHQTFALFVASGTPDEEIKEIVSRRDIASYFISVHGAPAEKAAIIRSICEEHGFKNRSVLMVGDAITDYIGARIAGVRFVGRSLDGQATFPSHVPVIPDIRNLYDHC
jgi:phosphoglycolate phosphatase-like HAD superfamily hydrolase